MLRTVCHPTCERTSDFGRLAVALALSPADTRHEYPSWFVDAKEEFEQQLKACLDREIPHLAARSLAGAALYPGRRVRPVLYLATWHYLRGTYPSRQDIAPALAVELFHAASIVVDDILDAEVARRNKIPLVRSHGAGLASLCSHLLVSAGQAILARHPAGPRLLATWVRAYKDAATGEYADVTARSQEDTGLDYAVILTKTTPFFRFVGDALAVQMGEQDEGSDSLARLFEALGRCFQIGNDVIDLLHVDRSGRLAAGEPYPLRPSYLALRLLADGEIPGAEMNRPARHERLIEIAALARAHLQRHSEEIAEDISAAAGPLASVTDSPLQACLANFALTCFGPAFWLHDHEE